MATATCEGRGKTPNVAGKLCCQGASTSPEDGKRVPHNEEPAVTFGAEDIWGPRRKKNASSEAGRRGKQKPNLSEEKGKLKEPEEAKSSQTRKDR